MSDEWEQKGPESEEDEAPSDAPFEWPTSREWGRQPEPEEPSRDPYSRDPYSREPYSREPYSPRQPYSGDPYSPDSYPPQGVLESHVQPRRSRDPLARLFPGLPHGVRVGLDWILTIAGAILIVLALKQWVVNPYRIPSSSMEPTLNCAKPALGCLGESSDRVLACRICLDFGPPSRGDIVVFNTPREAALKCGEGGTFVKREIGRAHV